MATDPKELLCHKTEIQFPLTLLGQSAKATPIQTWEVTSGLLTITDGLNTNIDPENNLIADIEEVFLTVLLRFRLLG